MYDVETPDIKTGAPYFLYFHAFMFLCFNAHVPYRNHALVDFKKTAVYVATVQEQGFDKNEGIDN